MSVDLYRYSLCTNLVTEINEYLVLHLKVVNGTKAYLRPLSSAVITQSQTLAAQNTTSVALLPQVRSFQTSPVTRDIDSAAKFIGAGAATVGVAGSGEWRKSLNSMKKNNIFSILVYCT